MSQAFRSKSLTWIALVLTLFAAAIWCTGRSTA